MSAPPALPPVRSDDRPMRRLGAAVLLLVFGVLGGWAAVTELDSAAVAAGVVTVESYRKSLQHLEGGIVREILVRDGDRVRAGDVLLRLDDTQARAQLQNARLRYFAALAMASRLGAERDHRDAVAFPPRLLAAMEEGENGERIRDIVATQRDAFAARATALAGEVDLLEQQIKRLGDGIGGQRALAASKAERIASYDAELADLRAVAEKKYIEAARIRPVERERAVVVGERAEHLAAIAAAENQIGELRRQIEQRRQERRREVAEQLQQVQAELFDDEGKIDSLTDILSRKEVRAPAEGVVVGLDVHTIGGVIAPGGHLLDLVPDGEASVVEAQVAPQDIDKVHAGLTAKVRFTAFNRRTTPEVRGEVATVSADRLVDRISGKPYYLARVVVSPEELKRLGGLTLVPGMPADVTIVIGSQTALRYLLKPLSDALGRAFREE